MDHETADEIKRHFGVVAEDLRSDVRAVAEGLGLLREEFDAHRQEFNGLRQEVGGLRQEFVAFRQDVAREFDETRALIRLSYSELDRRVRTLESDVVDLRGRLERVEGRLAS
jgi:hypothetical protein